LAIWANHDDIIDRVAWTRYVNWASAALRDIFCIVKHFISPVVMLLSYISYRHCQENETEKAQANFSPHEYFCLAQYLLGDIWHSICSACHFGRNRAAPAILAGQSRWLLPL